MQRGAAATTDLDSGGASAGHALLAAHGEKSPTLEMVKTLTSGVYTSVALLHETVRDRRSRIERLTDESIGDDHFWAAPWLRRRRGARLAHLGGSGGRGGDANR